MVAFHGSSYQRDSHHHVHEHMRSPSRRKNFYSKNLKNNRGRDKDTRHRGPFNAKLWIKSTWEAITTSLFFSPVLAVFFAIFLGFVCTYIDSVLSSNENQKPPVIWTTTTSSAQSLLSTVAGATISFAGTAFSVSLLVIQLASSQYSPRVVHTLFRDPFNRRIVALVVGTFTYCLVVMRSLGDNRQNEDDAVGVVPNVSVAVAFLLGIVSVLAIVAFIDHAANTMDVSQLLERITRDTIWHIQRSWELEQVEDDSSDDGNQNKGKNTDDVGSDVKGGSKQHKQGEQHRENASRNETDEDSDGQINEDNPKKPKSNKGEEAEAEVSTQSHVVRFRSSGWVQEIDFDLLLKMIPENGTMKVHTVTGRYAIPGTAVCSVSPKPTKHNWKQIQGENQNFQFGDGDEEEDDEQSFLDEFDSCVLDSILVGPSRTIRCDPTFGLRQLVDVILRALSPGINDPTTAQDGIFHVTAVVTEFCHRKIPDTIRKSKYNGRLILNEQPDYDTIVRMAFDEVRCCVSSNPTVALYLLESLRLIRESLQAGGYPRRAPEIERQARLIEEGIRNDTANIHDDHEMIVKARQDRFSTDFLAERNTDDMFA